MTQPRSIALFGSERLLADDTPVARDVRAALKGLHGRGFSTTYFMADGSAGQVRLTTDLSDDRPTESANQKSWIRLTSYRADTDEALLAALGRAAAADIIIRASGDGRFDERLDRAIFKTAPPRTQVVFWDFNPVATLDRLHAVLDDPFRTLIPKYDAILLSGGGALVYDEYVKLGARVCISVFGGLDQQTSDEPSSTGGLTPPATNSREQIFEHGVKELELALRPAALQPLPA